MKKISIFILLFAIFVKPCHNDKLVMAMMEKNVYAKVLTDCVLYKNKDMTEDLNNKYFVIPESYFVMVLEEVSQDCLKVQYGTYVGYIKSNKVIIATFTPIVKMLENITCDVKQSSGTQVWSTPSVQNGTVLTTIQAGTKNIIYIAMTYGEIPSGGESNIWYYVSYTPSTNSTNVYEGYIYSENTTNLSEIIMNTEENPEVIKKENNSVNNINLSSTIKTFIVAIIAIPIILFLAIILYKIIKKFKNNTILSKNINNVDDDIYGDNKFQTNINSHQRQTSKLKENINYLSNTSFIKKSRKQNVNNHSAFGYPEFPTYTSEDDLL